MQPIYATVSSTGGTNHSPWKLVNWHTTPINLGVVILSSGGNWQLDVTMDDPFGYYPNPTVGSTGITIFQSSQCAGGGVNAAAASAIGVITQPIAAWRLTSSSTTTGGTITATVLQSGMAG